MCDASLVSAAKSGDASAVRSILRQAASDAHRAALLDHRGEGTADASPDFAADTSEAASHMKIRFGAKVLLTMYDPFIFY